jgi:hypothetical protein
MFTGLALASLLASSPVSPPALPFDDARFELHLGGRAGGRFLGGPSALPTSFGGGLNVGLGVRLWQGLYIEVGLAEGVYQNPEQLDTLRVSEEATSFRHLGPHAAPAAEPSASPKKSAILAGQILLGLRYEIRTARTLRIRPSVFVGATHLHEATLRDFARQPGKTIAGVSDSIRHRTGAQLGFGLRVPFPERWGRVAPRFSARFDADVAYYFDAHPGRLHAGLGAGLQVVF